MRARPLNGRDDLLAVASRLAPSRACQRAIAEGRVDTLGGFTPPGGLPFYGLRVESRLGRVWWLAVEVDEEARRFRVRRLDGDPRERADAVDPV